MLTDNTVRQLNFFIITNNILEYFFTVWRHSVIFKRLLLCSDISILYEITVS